MSLPFVKLFLLRVMSVSVTWHLRRAADGGLTGGTRQSVGGSGIVRGQDDKVRHPFAQ
jgi:multisubunit Na+/H+ antiporter MnhB subunit